MGINLTNFLSSKSKSKRLNEFQDLDHIDGVAISTISANLYNNSRDDLVMFYFRDGVNYASVYTQSKIVSENIKWNLNQKAKKIFSLIVNTRNANCFTGKQGYKSLEKIAEIISQKLTQKQKEDEDQPKKINSKEIIFGCTGTIGEIFPEEKIIDKIPELIEKIKYTQNKYIWMKSALGIMTTDTQPKMAMEECSIGGSDIKIFGVAKGSGMIQPDMATTLAYIFTDADLPNDVLKKLLKKNISNTFNAISCDSDTSTNDMVSIFSTGKSKHPKIKNANDEKIKNFDFALNKVLLNLAKRVVADGEGASKFITVNIQGCKNEDDAKKIAFSIANSPLVDEIDSCLIDEARTPLIISGAAEDRTTQYLAIDKLIRFLKEKDYEVDEKDKNVLLTNDGINNIEKIFSNAGILKNNNFYDPENLSLVHHVNQALRANHLFQKGKDYIIQDDELKIIDELTGRILEGRRFGDGLHQALEAKERIPIKVENQTLASITYQNYFKLYDKISGCTGTAVTESQEFYEIYNLPVVVIPTNKKMIRNDFNDQIFRTETEKNDAIIRKIKECHQKGQPLLVFTSSINKSEIYSNLLNKENIKHEVLNAKNHENEAEMIPWIEDKSN